MKNYRLLFTKFITKIAIFGSHLLGYHGSSLPGYFSYVLYPGILKVLSKDVTTVFITGTNGKSMTSSFVYHLLGPEDTFFNSFGSNMETGIISSFLENTDWNGKAVKHIAVMECDECNLPLVARYVRNPIVAVLNVYQEQEERYGTAKDVTDAIIKGIQLSEASALCTGITQPELYDRLRTETNVGTVWTFGIPGQEMPGTDVAVSRDGNLVTVEAGDLHGVFRFSVPGEFNIENLAAAISVLKALGRCTEKELKRIEDLKPVEWHCQTIEYGDHCVQVYLVKNTESLNRCMALAKSDGSDICFFFEKSIVDGESSDWIRDADYTANMEITANAVCTGDFTDSMEESLKNAGVRQVKKTTREEFFRFLETTPKKLTVLANVEAMNKLKRKLEKKHP